MTRAAMSPGGSSAAAAAAAMSAALGPNASAAMSALGPSASVAASMASMASGHQVGFHCHIISIDCSPSSDLQASAAGLSASAANSAAATSYAALYAGLMGQSGLMGFPPGAAPPGFPGAQGAPRKE